VGSRSDDRLTRAAALHHWTAKACDGPTSASPMAFSRVTSGFKMRFHPILQNWTAHLGVDYAAPTGTPCAAWEMALSSLPGVQNGFGNVVIAQAPQRSTATVYAHLSRIHGTQGQRVSQTETLGAVGATGLGHRPSPGISNFGSTARHQDPLDHRAPERDRPRQRSGPPGVLHGRQKVPGSHWRERHRCSAPAPSNPRRRAQNGRALPGPDVGYVTRRRGMAFWSILPNATRAAVGPCQCPLTRAADRTAGSERRRPSTNCTGLRWRRMAWFGSTRMSCATC
jgi:murein DD-endopeptidase MepM/ murein hydrolase activator NlpD